MRSFSARLSFGLVACGLLAATSQGSILSTGTHLLGNHPDGAARPPLYGLRLDEMYNATAGHDIFTFDFEHASSLMQLTYTGSSIRIFGVAWGGRDTGGAYAADAYLGLYTIDFTYALGVMGVPSDDDIWVNAANQANSGTITTPLGHTKVLTDERGSHAYSFRLGNENNDLGHRGFPGISGWGWLRVDGVHTDYQDWIFRVVPAPGPVALAMVGLVAAARRRRQD